MDSSSSLFSSNICDPFWGEHDKQTLHRRRQTKLRTYPYRVIEASANICFRRLPLTQRLLLLLLLPAGSGCCRVTQFVFVSLRRHPCRLGAGFGSEIMPGIASGKRKLCTRTHTVWQALSQLPSKLVATPAAASEHAPASAASLLLFTFCCFLLATAKGIPNAFRMRHLAPLLMII